jgi:hypothetical protein
MTAPRLSTHSAIRQRSMNVTPSVTLMAMDFELGDAP